MLDFKGIVHLNKNEILSSVNCFCLYNSTVKSIKFKITLEPSFIVWTKKNVKIYFFVLHRRKKVIQERNGRVNNHRIFCFWVNNAFKYIPMIIIKDFNMHKTVLHKTERK